jgi:hypothetical protein
MEDLVSATLTLDAEQLHQLATALERLSEITEETGVDFSSYGDLSATIGVSNVRVAYDDGRYIVKDRNGD